MGAKRAVNLSLDSDLLDEAKSYGLNLSRTVESSLAETLKMERHRRWQAENASALADFDRYIDEHGLFGAEWRAL